MFEHVVLSISVGFVALAVGTVKFSNASALKCKLAIHQCINVALANPDVSVELKYLGFLKPARAALSVRIDHVYAILPGL